jgi:hypothetical protein
LSVDVAHYVVINEFTWVGHKSIAKLMLTEVRGKLKTCEPIERFGLLKRRTKIQNFLLRGKRLYERHYYQKNQGSALDPLGPRAPDPLTF